ELKDCQHHQPMPEGGPVRGGAAASRLQGTAASGGRREPRPRRYTASRQMPTTAMRMGTTNLARSRARVLSAWWSTGMLDMPKSGTVFRGDAILVGTRKRVASPVHARGNSSSSLGTRTTEE